MSVGDQSEYHLERARVELDLGYRAEHRRAAEAHMHLSALHMKRMKEMDESCSGTAPSGGYASARRPETV